MVNLRAFVGACFVAALAGSAAGAPPSVAMLPPILPFESSRHARKAEGLLELVQVAMEIGRAHV